MTPDQGPLNPKALASLERTNALLALVVVALAGIAWGPRGTAAAAFGCLLSIANLRAIGWLTTKAMAETLDGDRKTMVRLMVGLVTKMLALFALVAFGVWVLKLAILPFALGLLVLVASLLMMGLRQSLQEVA